MVFQTYSTYITVHAALKSKTLKLLEKTQKPFKDVNIRISICPYVSSQAHWVIAQKLTLFALLEVCKFSNYYSSNRRAMFILTCEN